MNVVLLAEGVSVKRFKEFYLKKAEEKNSQWNWNRRACFTETDFKA